MAKNGAWFQNRNRRTHLNENDDAGSHRHRRNRMDGDTQRAMIGVAVERMDVRNLDDCKQSQHHQAHYGSYHKTSWCPAVSGTYCAPCQKHHPLSRIHTVGCRPSPAG
jgi:hypothetical protein